jgi:hypothetical protein
MIEEMAGRGKNGVKFQLKYIISLKLDQNISTFA